MPGLRKTVALLGVVCLFLAAELFAQVRSGGGRGNGSHSGRGLGAGPGRVSASSSGRGLSAGRGLAPGRMVPSTGRSRSADGSAGDQPGSLRPSGSPSPGVSPGGFGNDVFSRGSGSGRTHGNILSPGSPGGSGPGSILSPGVPGGSGHGNILTPGTPGENTTPQHPALAAPPGSIRPSQFGDAFDDRFVRGRGRRGFRGPTVILPYGVPLYYPYYGSSSHYVIEVPAGMATGSSSEHVVTVDPGAQAEPERLPESKIFEVRPRTPGPRGAGGEVEEVPLEPDARGLGAAEDNPEEPFFHLIALKGGLIYAAREHWLEGNTLHYITTQGDRYVVPLAEVDLGFSERLNRERGMQFVLEVRGPTGRRVGPEGPNP